MSQDLELASTSKSLTLGSDDGTKEASAKAYKPVPTAESAKKKANETEKVDRNFGIRGMHLSMVLMMLLWLACIILRYANLEWGGVECDFYTYNDEAHMLCIRQNMVLRSAAVVTTFFAIQATLSVLHVEQVFDKYWLLKFPIVIVGAFLLLYFSACNAFNENVYIWWARIGGFIFLIFQQVILLDFAYMWNERWFSYAALDKNPLYADMVQESDCQMIFKNIWLLLIMVVAIINFAIFIASMALLFYFYGGSGCGTSNTIIALSLVGMLFAGFLQLSTSHGSLMTTTILMIYVAYVTYCAVAVNPDPTCNPFASNSDPNSYGTGPAIAGIFISFLSIVYMATISSRNITAILAQGGITQSALSNVIFGRNSGAAAMPDMKKRLRSSVLFFNLVYVFLAMYLAMIMTNWGLRVKDIGENQPPNSYLTMWMQATAAWITILLYIVALVTPLFDFMPKSVWDFYPRPGTM